MRDEPAGREGRERREGGRPGEERAEEAAPAARGGGGSGGGGAESSDWEPELGWTAREQEPQEPQEPQRCQLGPSPETPAWLVRASRRWEGAGAGGEGLRAPG